MRNGEAALLSRYHPKALSFLPVAFGFTHVVSTRPFGASDAAYHILR